MPAVATCLQLRSPSYRSGYDQIMITGLDFVAVPSTDAQRSRDFYVDTLGLRPDTKANFEFWVGETCFGIWEPASQGMEFTPGSMANDVPFALRGNHGMTHSVYIADPDGNGVMLHHRYGD